MFDTIFRLWYKEFIFEHVGEAQRYRKPISNSGQEIISQQLTKVKEKHKRQIRDYSLICFGLPKFSHSINQFYFISAQISIHRNKCDSSGQKKETMAKRYTLLHAHEKILD